MPVRKPYDIVVAGDANVDLLLKDVPPLEAGKEKLAAGADLTLGGSSSITALVLSKLGVRVTFAGVVGDDLLGKFVEKRLRAARIGTEALRRLREARTGITVWHSQGADRAGITWPGSVETFSESHVPESILARVRHLHVGAYFLLKGFHEGASTLFRKARRLGLSTSLDCNYDPSERWDSGIREVLKETDIFLPNEDEARLLCRGISVREAAAELARLAKIVVVKRGQRGVLVVSAGQTIDVPAVEVRVVETTGAGDSFNAGFLARHVRGATLEECARAGVEAGARAVSRGGGVAAFS